MEKILTGRQMLLCDRHTIDEVGIPSRELMERAARACCDILESSGFDLAHTAFVCGTGNNGGDGMAMAHILHEKGKRVSVTLVGEPEKCSEEIAFRLGVLKNDGIEISPEICTDGVSTVVDALFGAGLSRPLTGKYKSAAEQINSSGIPVFSVDIPSGISSDTGEVMGAAVRARACAAISNLKRGHVLYPGAEYCGRIYTAKIGISDASVSDGEALFAIEDGDLAPLCVRPSYTNKGSFGRVLVVGGCRGMAGAPYLSALAAYRSGAGLCEIFTPEDNRAIIQTLLPESVMTAYTDEDYESLLDASLGRADAVVIGPGLGMSDISREIVRRTFGKCKAPLVCDADALNIAAAEGLELPDCPTVITPHLGEMSRLTGKPIGEIQTSLVETAVSFARERGVVCLMKDARSIISDGKRTFVNLSGTSAMAKGGSGDVLTGVVAALLAYGLPPTDSAAFGAFIHGRAGERAAEKLGIHSLLARDIADSIRR